MPLFTAIGLMSGTSMDGVDVALIETDGRNEVRQGPSLFRPYGAADRKLLRAALMEAVGLTDRLARPPAILTCEHMVTRRHAEAVERFLDQNGIAAADVDVVGFHGQTVIHRPREGLTAQIGDGQGLADRLGIPVAFDFRAADVAAGGEGAPVVPVYHRALIEAADIVGPVAFLNIGGVANVTYVDDGFDPIACDTGPGNALLDDLMHARAGKPMDRGGRTAARGLVDEAALGRLLAHPYFEKKPPKSLDRNAFSRVLVDGLSLEDAAATLTAFTAASVARLLPHLPRRPGELVVCGGGARNPTLMRELALRLGCKVSTAQQHGWSVDAMEAQAFAYLAVRSMEGLPITFPTTTGVPAPLTGGILATPALQRQARA
jgi:anhydro-N-acetylmuramic acid kinase